jgi:NDP-sugar pyrophosphorylase family protein
MAGLGSRFDNNKQLFLPKPLIEISNKPMFQLSTDCYPLYLFDKIIFVCLKQYDDKYNLVDIISKTYSNYNIKIVILNQLSRGQSDTVRLGLYKENSNNGLLIGNCDSYFGFSFKKDLDKYLTSEYVDSNFIDYYVLENDITRSYSYLELDENDEELVNDIHEKTNPTKNISTGIYYFNTVHTFIETFNNTFNDSSYKEYYISYMYKTLLKTDDVFARRVKEFHDMGTPEGLNKFKLWLEKN